MARSVFFSFHYDADNWRVQQVKNMGRIESEPLLNGNGWEQVWRGGDAAIKRWIDRQMERKSCLVVLIGSETADRPWVRYEVCKAWNDGRGVLGIRIHGLKNRDGYTSTAGANPFDRINLGSGKTLAGIAPVRHPAGIGSKQVYATIERNLETWVEDAIRIRVAQ